MAKVTRYVKIVFQTGPDYGIALLNAIDDFTGLKTYDNKLIDCYTSTSSFLTVLATIPSFQSELNITIANNGTYNPNAVSPYYVKVVEFDVITPYADGYFDCNVILWHTQFPLHTYEYALVNEAFTDIYRYDYYNGNNIQDTFTIGTNKHSDHFECVSVDGGVSWMYPNNNNLVWGSNAPYYDDNLYDENKKFWIKFNIPPSVGINNIIIKYKPFVNKMKVFHKAVLSRDDEFSYIDISSYMRLLHYSLELVL